jgi:hypothetical protein
MMHMEINKSLLEALYRQLPMETRGFVDQSIERMIQVKRRGGKIVVAVGSGPNLHEGVTTLIAELMHKGVIDGVTSSSAVMAHELAGVLDRVKRCDADQLREHLDLDKMPKGNLFEFTEMRDADIDLLRQEILLDEALWAKRNQVDGKTIIKAAGNMAYPMGLRTEILAHEILALARTYNVPFEQIAGMACDPRTMLGAGARNGLPVLVSIPQLVGGGAVGMCIADSIPVSQRSARIAQMMAGADIIIESAVALTQEIHDGPFETYTGHGIWAMWTGYNTYSLKGKTLIRFDLDENLKKAWALDKNSGTVQAAIDQGLPKTKLSNIPFRMEMSAFARLETSIPVVGDIGALWPVIASKVCDGLGIELEFMSYPQQTPEGQTMREHIVDSIRPIDRNRLLALSRAFIIK